MKCEIEYRGIQPTVRHGPVELYNFIAPEDGPIPVGSTVTKRSLMQAGYDTLIIHNQPPAEPIGSN